MTHAIPNELFLVFVRVSSQKEHAYTNNGHGNDSQDLLLPVSQNFKMKAQPL